MQSVRPALFARGTRALGREDHRPIAYRVARGIIRSRRVGVIRGLIDHSAARRLTNPWFEIIVPFTAAGSRPHRSDRGDVARLPTRRHASSPASGSRRVDRDAVRERRPAGRPVRDRVAVQRRAARDVGRVRGHRVAQHDVRGVGVADVLDRDRVAQRLAGEQDVRVARQIGRSSSAPGRPAPTRSSRASDPRRPTTNGSAAPLTFGSSLTANGAPSRAELRLVGDDRAVGDRGTRA